MVLVEEWGTPCHLQYNLDALVQRPEQEAQRTATRSEVDQVIAAIQDMMDWAPGSQKAKLHGIRTA
jgi:hypothetical protein